MTMWVIERYVNGRLCYWTAGARGRSGRDDWVGRFDFATRFADEESATQVQVHLCDGEGRVTEHILCHLADSASENEASQKS